METGNVSDSGITKLLGAARQGDADALGKLLDAHRNYLRLLARLEVGRRLQAKIDASDLVQETFLQAHRAFPDFRGASEAEMLQWLRSILASRLSKAVRHYCGAQCRDLELERDLGRSSQALQGMLAISETSPSQRVVRQEQAVLLANAVERLPDDYREVIVLRNLRRLRFKEVAREMGRSVDSVHKLWARALTKLRLELEGHHERPE
jgi:RNA polymerase sigma-70 factor (ECF subfamily)